MPKKSSLSNLKKPVMTTPTAIPEMERQILGTVEPMRRNKPEPRATITVQLPYDLDLDLEDRATKLGIKKRDIIVAGIQMALKSPDFQ
jgi:hypothetical protein